MGTARLARKALRTRFLDQRPFILSHLITARCNADCVTCLWKMPADAPAEELSTHEVAALYRDAAEAGFLGLVVWGGEPFLRPDLGEVLAAARALGFNTTVITNGFFLEERAESVLPWVDRLLCSVDGPREVHDEARRCPGLFDRLDRGLARARRDHPRVRIVILSVLSRFNASHVETIAAYGRRHGVPVIFQAMNLTDYGFADRPEAEGARLDPREEQEAARRIARLRLRGYPVRDSGAYLRRLGDAAFRYRCHHRKVVLRVEPNGDVLDCTRKAVTLANVRRTRLADFMSSEVFRSFLLEAEACNRCRDAGVIETTHIWEGRPLALWNAVRALG